MRSLGCSTRNNKPSVQTVPEEELEIQPSRDNTALSLSTQAGGVSFIHFVCRNGQCGTALRQVFPAADS
jgi:hypothetical protein